MKMDCGGRAGLLAILVATTALTGAAASAQTPPAGTLTGLGSPNGTEISIGSGVSADGTVVLVDTFRFSVPSGVFLYRLGAGYTALPISPSAFNSDATVFVGAFNNGRSQTYNQFEAYRSVGTSNVVGLGFIGNGGPFPTSTANGISSDGAVVIGASTYPGSPCGPAVAFDCAQQASRWTQQTGTVGLGFVGGGGARPASRANAVSGDGLVAVGDSTNAANRTEAFRWSAPTGMVGLGFLPGAPSTLNSISSANATNTDGSVVVGSSTNASNREEAFRWTAATGMVGLGYTAGGGSNPFGVAFGVSGNGAVVVGVSTAPTPQDSGAFRWTQATGTRSLYGLLANAGVGLSGFQSLFDARAISPNGQFITGVGTNASGFSEAYLVRYMDEAVGGGTTPIGGVTTPGAVSGSADELARSRARIIAQQHGFAAPLLGASQPIGVATEVGIFASAGSVSGGGTARIALGNGFSLLGGIAYAEDRYKNVTLKDAVFGAVAARYVFPQMGLVSPFVEAGGWFAPDAGFEFRRPYANGSGLAVGRGSTTGDISYGYGRGGVAIRPWEATEIALAGEVGYQQLSTGSYREPLVASNPFDASVYGSTDSLVVGKIRGQVTHAFTDIVDATLYLAAATADGRARSRINVAGFGFEIGRSDRPQWLEYGARIGFKITPQAQIDIFTDGVTQSESSRFAAFRSGPETSIHTGAAFRYRF